MSHRSAVLSALSAGVLLLGLVAGCQRAGRYEPRSPRAATGEPKKDATKESSPDDLVWQLPTGEPSKDVPIEFVTEKDSEWQKLPSYWNDPAIAAAALIGLGGKGGLLPGGPPADAIKIKVPVGLPNPSAYVPSGNPPTRRKWQLGRRLFFDETILTAKGGVSCATCHVPSLGYTDGKKVATSDGLNTPTLINVVYNAHQFWDGRVTYLEEVVQARPEDELSAPDSGAFRHAWSGVIGRLRADKKYTEEFDAVFRTKPTQDAVGKAIATYLRTILAGNSVQDRAEQKRRQAKAGQLTVAHYTAALTPADQKVLGRPDAEPGVVAVDLLRGHELFTKKAACAACHSPRDGLHSDNDFHNIGVGLGDFVPSKLKPVGRFVHAPIGLKSRHLWGAHKTPTLRSLLRTAPYFHNGQEEDLGAVVRFHVVPPPQGEGAREPNQYLDPKLLNPDGITHKNFGLRDDDIRALVLFLRGLNGDDVDKFIQDRPK
jgi:cytochrome c peroxidase